MPVPPGKMSVDEAIAVFCAMDMNSVTRFTPKQIEAMQTIGCAGWNGDLQPDDARIVVLPEQFRTAIQDLVRIMQSKRIIQ